MPAQVGCSHNANHALAGRVVRICSMLALGSAHGVDVTRASLLYCIVAACCCDLASHNFISMRRNILQGMIQQHELGRRPHVMM